MNNLDHNKDNMPKSISELWGNYGEDLESGSFTGSFRDWLLHTNNMPDSVPIDCMLQHLISGDLNKGLRYNGWAAYLNSLTDPFPIRRWDPVTIREGIQHFKSSCQLLPPSADIRNSTFSIETKHLTRDQLINMGYLPDEDQE